MYIDLREKYRLFLSDFNKIRIVSRDFSRSPQIPNFMNIRPVRADLFQCGRTDRRKDGRTAEQADVTQLIVTSRNCVNAP